MVDASFAFLTYHKFFNCFFSFHIASLCIHRAYANSFLSPNMLSKLKEAHLPRPVLDLCHCDLELKEALLHIPTTFPTTSSPLTTILLWTNSGSPFKRVTFFARETQIRISFASLEPDPSMSPRLRPCTRQCSNGARMLELTQLKRYVGASQLNFFRQFNRSYLDEGN